MTTKARKSPQTTTGAVTKKKVSLLAQDPDRKTWKSFYALTEHWKSDILFFIDELAFFRKLMLDHFAALIDLPHIERTRSLSASLQRLEKRSALLFRNVGDHQTLLAKAIKNPFPPEGAAYKSQHAAIEDDLASFAKDFRSLKKDLFVITEEILRTEKARNLLYDKRDSR